MGYALQTADEHPCPHCRRCQATAAFAVRNRLGKGTGWCKGCLAAAARAWNHAHPDRRKKIQADYSKRRREKRKENARV